MKACQRICWLRFATLPPSVERLHQRNSDEKEKRSKMRTTGPTAWIWLAVKENPSAAARRTWLGFNAVVDIALLTFPLKR